jgi:SNF2 family DNA or RNA helicase
VIVVSYFTSTLDFVGRILRDNEINCIKLDGKVDGKDREIVVNSFEREKSVLLLSGKAGGTGLTLVCAKTMIIL